MNIDVKQVKHGLLYHIKLNGKKIINVKRENGFWTAYDIKKNRVIDKDQYRNDLFKRLDLMYT